MPDSGLLDESLWEGIVGSSPGFEGNAEGAAHLTYRFVGQYLPALLRARSQQEQDRVWLAFWSYLIARATTRKPFGLSHEAADELIAELKQVLSEGSEHPTAPPSP